MGALLLRTHLAFWQQPSFLPLSSLQYSCPSLPYHNRPLRLGLGPTPRPSPAQHHQCAPLLHTMHSRALSPYKHAGRHVVLHPSTHKHFPGPLPWMGVQTRDFPSRTSVIQRMVSTSAPHNQCTLTAPRTMSGHVPCCRAYDVWPLPRAARLKGARRQAEPR